jgi:hypothetical protein
MGHDRMNDPLTVSCVMFLKRLKISFPLDDYFVEVLDLYYR